MLVLVVIMMMVMMMMMMFVMIFCQYLLKIIIAFEKVNMPNLQTTHFASLWGIGLVYHTNPMHHREAKLEHRQIRTHKVDIQRQKYN